MNNRHPRLDDPRLDRASDCRRRARALRQQARGLNNSPAEAQAAADARAEARRLSARADRLEEAATADGPAR